MFKIHQLKEKVKQLQDYYKILDNTMEYDHVLIKTVNETDLAALSNYPLEYVEFLKEIGEVSIVKNGCFMIDISLPTRPLDCWWLENNIMHDSTLRVIVHTDNDNIEYVIFNTSSIPYKRYSHLDLIEVKSFLEIVENKIDELVFDLR
jgi:hypothetical protein